MILFIDDYDSSNVVGYPLGGPYTSPKVTLTAEIGNPQGLLFDSAGDLWVASAVGIAEYARNQLTQPAPRPRTVILGGVSFAGAAVDSDGNLWVDDYGANDVDEYAKKQLTGTGLRSPHPKVVLTGNDLNLPFGLAFDRAGDLWIGNEGNGLVLEYAKSELVKSGSPAPKLAISGNHQVEGVAFDSSGNLWTTTGQGGSVIEYAKSQLTNPRASPAVSLTAHLSWPTGVIFDSSGNLWVSDYGGETLTEFSKAQLRKSGPVVTRPIIQGMGGPGALAIGP
jgi:sugar lactone lactonase YvrE